MVKLEKKIDFKKILSILEKTHHPTMLEILKEYTPFQLLVATLLSARTKDSRLIPIVQKLFQEYPQPEDFIKIPLPVLEQKLYTVGFYRMKAKNVKKLSQIVVERYYGQIPITFSELTSLPGVGRKTANCILACVFHQPAIGVDTHVHRISNRLGWVKTNTPEETEEELNMLVTKAFWVKVNNLLVDHGQRICQPLKPRCGECSIREYCVFGKSLVH